MAYEVNFDGIVGPTHNYAGLAVGNLASQANKGKVSNPKQAALQGLHKAKLLADLGVKQAVLPPNLRPNLRLLRNLGFSGTDAHMIATAFKQAPELLAACYSASSMWAANLATVSPSVHTADGRVHFTVANLISNMHRAQEAEQNSRILRAIFSNEKLFCIHEPLFNCKQLCDEGDANHSIICPQYGVTGAELFVYGARGFGSRTTVQQQVGENHTLFPARQTLEASQTVARLHTIAEGKVVFAQQNPQAIAQGVFHNDVAFVANQNVLFHHQKAFVDNHAVVEQLQQSIGDELILVEIAEEVLSLQAAVATYLFNSQLVTVQADGFGQSMHLIAPEECRNHAQTKQVLDAIIADGNNPLHAVHFVNCRQSMQNGGGPACLRLRVVLTAEEIDGLAGNVLLTEQLYARLITWVEKHYRDCLLPEDLADPLLYKESIVALDELSTILALPGIYS